MEASSLLDPWPEKAFFFLSVQTGVSSFLSSNSEIHRQKPNPGNSVHGAIRLQYFSTGSPFFTPPFNFSYGCFIFPVQ